MKVILNSAWLDHRAQLCVLGALAVLGWGGAAQATPAGHVTFLEGHAYREAAGQRAELANGAEVQEHDTVSTAAKGRLEITLADKSTIRLGPASKVEITLAQITDDGRKLSARLVLGTIWAKVATALGGTSKFEVTTERAVAGVRGTTFRVDASKDKAVLVKVYAGAVAVAGNQVPAIEHAAPGGGRQRVPGPQQVTAQQWEKIVGSQMQMRVSAAGTPEEPQKFAEADDCKDAWSRWNRERDGDPCPR